MVLVGHFLDIVFPKLIQKSDETNKDFKNRKRRYNQSKQKLPGYANNNFKILDKFPRTIKKIVKDYWSSHAEIRSYRNLDQHQYQLYYHSFYRLEPKEEFVLYLPDKITRDMELHDISYNKKIIALELFEREFKAFHDFVEKMLEQIKIPPAEIKPGISFSPLEDLAKYKNGDLLSIMITGKDSYINRISNINDPNSKGKRLDFQFIPNKITSFRWEFK
jgi:hypothetical protein